jgi:hypothetical protein
MVSSFVCRKLIVIIFAVSLALSACHGGEIGGKYPGTKYVGKNMTVEFKSGNTAYITIMITGDIVQKKYEVDGDRVIIDNFAQGNNIVFTRGSDGALRSTGIFGDTLICSNCGPTGGPKTGGFSGKYRTEIPANSQAVILEFRPDYTASMTIEKAGAIVYSGATTYSVDGDKIHFRLPQGESIFTKNRDGSLTSSTNALFKKVN